MSARDVIACFLDHPSVFMGGPSERNQRKADAILAALSAAGWVVVPREPTEAMLDAAFADAVAWLERVDIGNTDCKSDRERSAEPNRSIYRAMLAAAFPAAPQEDKR